jgi:hypothetical protein
MSNIQSDIIIDNVKQNKRKTRRGKKRRGPKTIKDLSMSFTVPRGDMDRIKYDLNNYLNKLCVMTDKNGNVMQNTGLVYRDIIKNITMNDNGINTEIYKNEEFTELQNKYLNNWCL